jgi:heterotetrameric sarcosine oxidase gamma subunit
VFGPETTLTLSERPRSLVQLMARKGKEDLLAAAVKSAFALELPPPGKWTAGAAVQAIGIEPRAWLLEAEPGDAFPARVSETAASLGAAVDQSGGRSVIRLAGADARRVLSTVCRLDLHPRAFGPGSSAATRVAHVGCVIRLIDDVPSFDLIVGSTYARWLIEELVEAAHGHDLRFQRAPAPHTSAMPPSGTAP